MLIPKVLIFIYMYIDGKVSFKYSIMLNHFVVTSTVQELDGTLQSGFL